MNIKSIFLLLFLALVIAFLTGCSSGEYGSFSFNEKYLDKDCTSLVNDYMRKIMRGDKSCCREFVKLHATKARLIAYSPKNGHGVALVEFEIELNVPKKYRENRFLFSNQVGYNLNEEQWNRLLAYTDGSRLKLTTLVQLVQIGENDSPLALSQITIYCDIPDYRYLYEHIGTPLVWGARIEDIQQELTRFSENWRHQNNGPSDKYAFFSKDTYTLQ